MKIAVVGGTGMLGRHVVKELRLRGHEVRLLSRNVPEYRIDLITGEGLTSALKGCDVVVDASNAQKQAEEIWVNGSRRLLAAEEAVGVGHHICVSIVGCDKVPFGYFRVKTEQEHVIEHGQVPWTIVRATQFHEYIAGMLVQAGRLKMLPLPHMPLQTVAVSEVARTIADTAEAAPRHGRIEIAGPEIVDALELAHIWRTVTGTRGLLLPIPLFGKIKRTLRAGALTADRPDFRGKLRFAECVKEEERYQ